MKLKHKKLSLKTETLRRLVPVPDADLAQVAGAGHLQGGARRTALCNTAP